MSTGRQALREAALQAAFAMVARAGNVQAAQLLLSHGAKVDAQEEWDGGKTALMWAAAQGQPEMVRFLLAQGADPNARGAVRNGPGRVMARSPQAAKRHTHRGGLTPLLHAAHAGCVQCAKHLLQGGALIDLEDPDGVTPLLLALTLRHFELAAELIRAGADVNRCDFSGRTPLHVAIEESTSVRGRADRQALQAAGMLLQAGATPNVQLVRHPWHHGAADPHQDELTGATPLLLAAAAGNAQAVELLLAHQAAVDLPSARGVTPLMAAAGMGCLRNRRSERSDRDAAHCVKLILSACGSINMQASDGATALHSAAARGWSETVEVLITAAADLQPRDALGMTPIDYAAGHHPRAFLEQEPVMHADTMALLKSHIVMATGQPPIEPALCPIRPPAPGHSVTPT